MGSRTSVPAGVKSAIRKAHSEAVRSHQKAVNFASRNNLSIANENPRVEQRATAYWVQHQRDLAALERVCQQQAELMIDAPPPQVIELLGTPPPASEPGRRPAYARGLNAVLHYTAIYGSHSDLFANNVPADINDNVRTSLQVHAILAIADAHIELYGSPPSYLTEIEQSTTEHLFNTYEQLFEMSHTAIGFDMHGRPTGGKPDRKLFEKLHGEAIGYEIRRATVGAALRPESRTSSVWSTSDFPLIKGLQGGLPSSPFNYRDWAFMSGRVKGLSDWQAFQDEIAAARVEMAGNGPAALGLWIFNDAEATARSEFSEWMRHPQEMRAAGVAMRASSQLGLLSEAQLSVAAAPPMGP